MTNKEFILNRITATGGGDLLDDFLSFPRYVQIETIQNCNARCVMCGINE
ncbi:hypothetical protein [Helicobacter sp. WB40]|nr:hypothetical protein [Helicobacter sp. WB40]MDA3967426.1 hypothetical protein [Helicobacter sp. WB40]